MNMLDVVMGFVMFFVMVGIIGGWIWVACAAVGASNSFAAEDAVEAYKREHGISDGA